MQESDLISSEIESLKEELRRTENTQTGNMQTPN
jgi:hypothetical protein